jgi:cytochrome c
LAGLSVCDARVALRLVGAKPLSKTAIALIWINARSPKRFNPAEPEERLSMLAHLRSNGQQVLRVGALLVWGALLSIATSVTASEFGSREEARAMVERVQAMFKSEGPAATFKAVSDQSIKEFHDRDLYPFIYDLSGRNVAHGARPSLIGKNLIDLKDQDGRYLIREIIATAKGRPGHGWVDYKWPNSLTNKIEDKSSYIELMGNYLVGVGVSVSELADK